ncbi:Os12g0243050, partial [Oryza sativa Japonica Group]
FRSKFRQNRPDFKNLRQTWGICIQILVYEICSEFTGFLPDFAKFRISPVPETEGPVGTENPGNKPTNQRLVFSGLDYGANLNLRFVTAHSSNYTRLL